VSLIDRLLGRTTDRPLPPSPPVAVDPDLEQWVETATALSDGMGVNGRLVVALLGESLAGGTASPWFGHEPHETGLGDLLDAVGESRDAADGLLAIESGLASRRPGALTETTRTAWRSRVEAAVRDAAEHGTLPGRDAAHLEAEQVWRAASAAVQPWRAVQLDPDGALGQIRWYPGCTTRTVIGYADPLGLAMVQRAVQEHRYSDEEWQALGPADELVRREVDPLVWRISSLSYVVAQVAGGAR
jgi:hypothetical protein